MAAAVPGAAASARPAKNRVRGYRYATKCASSRCCSSWKGNCRVLDVHRRAAGRQGVDTSLTTQELVAAAHAKAAAHNEGFLLAHALRDIVAKEYQLTHRITRGDLSLYVQPAPATVLATKDLSPELIAELAHVSSALEVVDLGANDALPADADLRRLTSILMNNAYTLQQMTNLTAQPVANIRGFLNACALCGLLTHESLAAENA